MVFSSRGGSSPGGRHAPPWDLSNLGAQTSHFLSFPQDIFSKQIRRKWHTVFPWIIPGGDYFFFRIKRGKGGWLFEGRRLFQLLLTGRRAQNIYIYIHIFLIPLNQAIITSNKLNMGFLSVPNWVPGLIFGAWIITHQFCWIRFHFNFTRRVQKKEKMTRGWGGGGRLLFEGGEYFKYFHQRGAINRGTAILQGNTVVSSLIHISSVICKVQCLRKRG